MAGRVGTRPCGLAVGPMPPGQATFYHKPVIRIELSDSHQGFTGLPFTQTVQHVEQGENGVMK